MSDKRLWEAHLVKPVKIPIIRKKKQPRGSNRNCGQGAPFPYVKLPLNSLGFLEFLENNSFHFLLFSSQNFCLHSLEPLFFVLISKADMSLHDLKDNSCIFALNLDSPLCSESCSFSCLYGRLTMAVHSL